MTKQDQHSDHSGHSHEGTHADDARCVDPAISGAPPLLKAPDELAGAKLTAQGMQTPIRIMQMDCPTEEGLLRSKLGGMPGVAGMEFNLMKRVLTVTHEPKAIEAILDAVRSLGFTPEVAKGVEPLEDHAPEPDKPWWPLALAGLAAIGSEAASWAALPTWVSATLALVAVLLSGLTTYKKGWIAIRNFNLNINALMSIAVTGAIFLGLWPEAAMVMVLFTVAELIEAKSLDRARNAIKGLMQLTPERATVLQSDGSWLEVAAKSVPVDARVRIKPGERMIAVLDILRSNRHEIVALEALGLDESADLYWLSAPWKKLVLVKTAGRGKAESVHRRYLELAILQAIKDDLKSGDLFIKYGERYDDFREGLVDDATFAKEIEQYGAVTGIETEPKAFVSALKAAMSARIHEVDASFPENSHAEIVDGRLLLRKPPRSETTETLAALEQVLTQRMKRVSIVDIIVDVVRWLDLDKLFRPLAGTDSRLEDLRMRVVTTLFCYGCNLGPEQTSKSIKGLSRRQIAWLNLKYMTDDDLDKGVVKAINAYNKFELPRFWGTGAHASADGTKWSMYEQNLLSEHHIRYGGYGGIGYYHVSDKYIALFSHFIACGRYEGHYILDGLESNESDIRPDTIHGDTQAQSYPVFALAHLLGIKLMPRIRGIQSLKFFRAEAKSRCTNINDLFSDTIDWKLIEQHLPAMLRVAVSIKAGKITPSAILRRLGTYSSKNKLYFGFIELGKVIRTMFLLSYIGDVNLRKVIHAETNKSEQFNAFAGWSFFGGDGVIAENLRHEQRKVIKYNHLVANMIILHNVDGMTKILKELRDEGYEITEEVLAGLAPFRTHHINKYGDYTLDFRRKSGPLVFDLEITPKKPTPEP